jgi:hypothetical protein
LEEEPANEPLAPAEGAKAQEAAPAANEAKPPARRKRQATKKPAASKATRRGKKTGKP